MEYRFLGNTGLKTCYGIFLNTDTLDKKIKWSNLSRKPGSWSLQQSQVPQNQKN